MTDLEQRGLGRAHVALRELVDLVEEPRRDVEGREDLDLLFGGEAERRGDAISERARIVLDVADLSEATAALGEIAHVILERAGDEPRLVGASAGLLGDRAFDQPERIPADEGAEREAADRFEREPVLAARQPDDVVDADERADAVEIVLAGIDVVGILLRGDAEHRAALEAGGERDRALTADRESHQGAGEKHSVAEREEGKRRGGRRFAVAERRHEGLLRGMASGASPSPAGAGSGRSLPDE